MSPIRLFAVVVTVAASLAAQSSNGQRRPKVFMGRPITVVEAQLAAEGMFPKGPASICLEGAPRRQCYTAPKDFGKDPKVEVVKFDATTSAILFSAAGGGMSGWPIHFALLRPGPGTRLENLFFSDLSLSNQSQYRFLERPELSKSPIFVTADYRWGVDESHFGEHRFIVSAYRFRLSTIHGTSHYYLEDQYMTVRRYDVYVDGDVIASEREEIFRRLSRLGSAK